MTPSSATCTEVNVSYDQDGDIVCESSECSDEPASNVFVSFGDVDFSNSTVDILMDNSSPVGGFQFSLTGASIFIDNSVNPRIITANVNGSSNYSYSWLDTNGIQLSTLSQYPFYTQWCVTITDLVSGCDTTICENCIPDTTTICPCLMIYMPVCGCDGFNYTNSSAADCNGVLNYYEGPCK